MKLSEENLKSQELKCCPVSYVIPEYQGEIYSIRVLSSLGSNTPAYPEQGPSRDRPASEVLSSSEVNQTGTASCPFRNACLPGVPLGTHGASPPPCASLSPQAGMCSHFPAADGLPAVSAHCWCVHVLLLSVCLIQMQINLIPWLLLSSGHIHLFFHTGPDFEPLSLIPLQCSACNKLCFLRMC